MAEKSIELDSVEIAAAIFGNCDRNIRLLEKEFSSRQSAGVRCFASLARRPMLRLLCCRAVKGMLLLIENQTPLETRRCATA